MIGSTGRSSTWGSQYIGSRGSHRPSGTVTFFWHIPGNKLPGYLHLVPSGQQTACPLPWQIKAGETIAVIGPTMDAIPAVLGDYSGFPVSPTTMLQGIINYFTASPKYQPLGVKIVSEPAVSLPDNPRPPSPPITWF
jgi:hypothetical protein